MARRVLGILATWAAIAAPLAAQLQPVWVPVSGPATLDSLARLGFEVGGVARVDGRLQALVVVSPSTAGRLAARGFTVSPVPGAPLAGTAADTYHVFRSFEKPVTGIRAQLTAWAAADTLIHVDSIGASIEGRPILAVKIGSAADAPTRPNVLFMGTHHAREWVSTEMAMRLIRWLADSLSPTVLATRDIWVIPVENPDGYQYTFTTDRYWRKNRRHNSDGTYGVDPNRNYPAFWGYDESGSSSVPGTEIYRGTARASEPETQTIIAFHAAHPPVVSVSYHTYGGLVLNPYGFRTGELAPDLPIFRALGGTDLGPAVLDSVPATFHGAYHPGPGWSLYTTNGEYTDWAYRAHGTIAFTTELTSGCCTPDSGFYYGFAFPDDSALVERVFRDNLPFALAVIAAAGDVAAAMGPGLAHFLATPPRVESVWPETRVSLPTLGPAPYSLTVRTATGAIFSRSMQTDSLWRGVVRTSWRNDVSTIAARAVRVDGAGLAAELVSLAGAEPGDAGWTGWTRTNDALAGSWAWEANGNDTLTSPAVDLTGRSRLWLQFWTKYRGSTFTPQVLGRVEYSGDDGATWTEIWRTIGDGPSWYPVRVDLPVPAGPAAARVRFISEGFNWWVDAVGFVSDSTSVFQSLPPVARAEVSENPVRGTQVVISWPPPTGAAGPRVGVYSFSGDRLVAQTLPSGATEFVWDLMAGNRPVPNGAYLVVVQVDGQVLRRRLFVTRP
jgi:hypothetical protein